MEAKLDADEKTLGAAHVSDDSSIALEGEVVNASGHRDQLKRELGFFSICGTALNIDAAWIAVGTTLTVAIRTLNTGL